MIRIENITLEGPDLAGKTSLYSSLHKKTGYRWDIRDRSFLSMVCYARQFNRGEDFVDECRQRLHKFLSCLNNQLIILLPSVDVLVERYRSRGDDIQDEESLVSLHTIYEEEVDRLRLWKFPNVLVHREVVEKSDTVARCLEWLESIESNHTHSIPSDIINAVLSSRPYEIPGFSFRAHIDTSDVRVLDRSVMEHPPEEVYYAKILQGVLSCISKEISGINEYRKPQDPLATRRFIYTQDSCISLIHTMIRGSTLRMRVFCRSSDVENTFEYDFKFLCYLLTRVVKHIDRLSPGSLSGVKNHILDVELGSAHIVR